jgi:CheY-like chemotaxis protein
MRTDTSSPVVLLVEESEDDAFFFERTLQKAGTTGSVQRAVDGAEAIAFLRTALAGPREKLPRVVFLDLKMPVLNGFEVLEWIATEPFPPEMRVIVLSGSDHHEDRSRAAHLGATDYLVKPVRVRDLQRLLPDLCPKEAGAQV